MSGKWVHPTGNKPEAIHMVMAGYTARDYMAAVGVYNSKVPTDVEVWSLNKALRSIRADFGFVLDDIVGEYRIDNTYLRDLRKINIDHNVPIVTTTIDEPVQEIIGDGANWYEYPIQEIRDFLGNNFADKYYPEATEDHRKNFGRELLYMKNSLPMMLAYALFIGVRTIFLWGADYTHPAGQRREADQPNAEYWVGYLRGMGVQVVLSSDTTLCSVRDGPSIYGYGARQPAL